jgi:hypothetical protein
MDPYPKRKPGEGKKNAAGGARHYNGRKEPT